MWKILVAVLALAPACAHACPVEQAHYVMDGQPGVEAGFRPVGRYKGWISDVAFFVRTPARTDYFLFDQGSAPYVSLISTTDVTEVGWAPPDPDGGVRPLGGMTYYSLHADRSFYQNVIPKAGEEAPAQIFLPDLAEIMWYRGEPRQSVPHAFLTLVQCGDAPLRDAGNRS